MSSGLLGGSSSIAGVALGMNFSSIGDPQVGQNFSFSVMPTIDAYPTDPVGTIEMTDGTFTEVSWTEVSWTRFRGQTE